MSAIDFGLADIELQQEKFQFLCWDWRSLLVEPEFKQNMPIALAEPKPQTKTSRVHANAARRACETGYCSIGSLRFSVELSSST
jgi:hypothetical protein